VCRSKLYKKIKEVSRGCRDNDVKIKVNLFLLGLKLGSITEACARRGFSRQFYYLWWKRFEASGFKLPSLQERSRRPKRSPNQASERVERAIRWYSKRQNGARMIQALMVREQIKISRTTICHILNDRKPSVKKKRDKLKAHRKRYELTVPGQRLQMDVKYAPSLVEGRKAYVYVIIDECTRWRYARAYDNLCEGTTIEFLNEVEQECPFPMTCIQTDNGQEFTYRLNPIAKHIKHKVDIWCDQRSIRHRLIPPGVKELNGKVERSHRIDEQYFYYKAPTTSLRLFNRALDNWLGFYNTKRLHGGLGYTTPMEKLLERLQTLKTMFLPPELESIKLKFLEQTPRRATKQDRQILKLERELQSLLLVA
jgi:transposase InsO family protein